MSKGAPPALTTDTPELIRIRKAQEQLSEVTQRTSHSLKLLYL